MTIDQPPKRVLWIATQETPEQLAPYLSYFEDAWTIKIISKSEDLIKALIWADVKPDARTDLLIWGGDIRDSVAVDNRNVGLDIFLKVIRDIYPRHKLNILPFYPEDREKDNSQILEYTPELKRVRSNVQVIGELGDHPRQAIQVPANMEKLEITLGLRQGIGMEGQITPASSGRPEKI